MLSKNLLDAEAWSLCYRNKQTFLVGKNMLIVMVSILINKAVFESRL